MRLRIKNWEKFQHYKERRPLWIKLYRDLLDDKDWDDLPAPAAKALVMLWLIASEEDGYLPDSRTLAFRLRISSKRMEDLLAKCSAWFEHDASLEKRREETEKRREEAEATAAFSAIGFDAPFGQKKFQQVWEEEYEKPADWLTMKMESTIQECQRRKIGIPPQFYAAKRDVEARENAEAERKFHRAPL